MLSINELKQLRSLRQKKYRNEYQKFLVEGTKSVLEVLQSDFVVEKVYATQQWKNKHPDFFFDTQIVSAKECARISSLSTPPEVFASVQMKPKTEFCADNYQRILLLDGVNYTGNFGTILRTADWFGVEALVCSEDTVELFNPKAIQASMGSFTRVSVFYQDLKTFIDENKDNYTFFGTFMKGKSVRDISFPKKSAIVLGSESHGISDEITRMVNETISIEMAGDAIGRKSAESLNVSLAAAIVCYEMVK